MTNDVPFLTFSRTSAAREGDGLFVTFQMGADATIDAVVEEFANFLVAVGYHPDSVKETLGEACSW
jgi:gamma-glutamyl-gamma-aminobutyrate hydrolase PuuD